MNFHSNISKQLQEMQDKMQREYLREQEILKIVAQLSAMGLKVNPQEAFDKIKALIS